MEILKIPPNPLLAGITDEEQKKLLECLKARVCYYNKGECLVREQETIEHLGIILEGSVEASKLEMSGRRLVFSRPGRGSVFGDVLSLHPKRFSPVTVTALEYVSVLMIPAAGLLEPCQKRCGSHDKLLRNLLNSVSEKYFELHDRIFCITQPTLRDKIMYFLESESTARRRIFDIPYDRAALAEYLNAERSALSRELSAMRRDGLIDYHKNKFRLL